MQDRGYGQGRQVSSAYTADQVESVLNECGIEIVSDTEEVFLCFCPYHGNKYTPSFAVSKSRGIFCCYNQACAESGNLVELIKHTTSRNDYEALRLIARARSESITSVFDQVQKNLTFAKLPEFSQDSLDRMYRDFWYSDEAQAYMHNRGFEDDTLKSFRIGYSELRNMITVPMYSLEGKPLGIIGRKASDTDKTFKNSKKLPKNQSLWNVHRARRAGNTVIICEASFDAMRISQAGYPNVVAVLGGNFSEYHKDQLDRYFTDIVIMTDYDDKEKHKYQNCKKCAKLEIKWCVGHNPGRVLGEKIAQQMSNKSVRWASYDSRIVYPPGAKDAGDLTDDQIRQCIKNAVPNVEYHTWGIDKV